MGDGRDEGGRADEDEGCRLTDGPSDGEDRAPVAREEQAEAVSISLPHRGNELGITGGGS